MSSWKRMMKETAKHIYLFKKKLVGGVNRLGGKSGFRTAWCGRGQWDLGNNLLWGLTGVIFHSREDVRKQNILGV